MSTPAFKIYTELGEYIGAVRYAEDAAALVYLHTGGTVRFEHKHVVWREGAEGFSAGDSYDEAAEVMRERVTQRRDERLRRLRARQDAFARGELS